MDEWKEIINNKEVIFYQEKKSQASIIGWRCGKWGDYSVTCMPFDGLYKDNEYHKSSYELFKKQALKYI